MGFNIKFVLPFHKLKILSNEEKSPKRGHKKNL